ncbi:MAG TPA: ABC transporter permease [Spirochaetota bacterium]|nr:ABC transporter permease [Spirochaetota bacterium]HRZ28660.1 ABC transporter permease [Spirochaetota bacterium]HSA16319.1 ABC transporter permease [Spirochaetota bacterium]
MNIRLVSLPNPRQKSAASITACLILLCSLFILNAMIDETGLGTDLGRRYLAPGHGSILGTDWLGRDMFTRITKGLCMSFHIGIMSAIGSSLIAVIMGLAAAVFGKKVDAIVALLIDAFLSVPHIVLLILVSFTLGGGFKGIVIAVCVSHWSRLARIIRAEILQLKGSDYIMMSYRLGRSRRWIMAHHMLPHVSSQFLIGLILMFPHAILHAAGLSFLGFGMTPDRPCIGVLLSESMRHISTGYWWLALFPGAALVALVKIFDVIGENASRMLNPRTKQE